MGTLELSISSPKSTERICIPVIENLKMNFAQDDIFSPPLSHIYGDLEIPTVCTEVEIVPCGIHSSGKPDFVCTMGFTEAEWDGAYKIWKQLSEYDSDLHPDLHLFICLI